MEAHMWEERRGRVWRAGTQPGLDHSVRKQAERTLLLGSW